MITLEDVKMELELVGIKVVVVKDVDISTKRVTDVKVDLINTTKDFVNIREAVNFTLSKQAYLLALGKIQASEKVTVAGTGVRKSKWALTPLEDETEQ